MLKVSEKQETKIYINLRKAKAFKNVREKAVQPPEKIFF